LHFDALEPRDCPSTVTTADGTLVVRGDDNANTIEITDDGQGNLTVVVDGETFNGTAIQNLVIHGRDGDDVVSYTLDAERALGLHIGCHMGDDNDTVTLDFAAGFSGPRLKVDLHGGKGDNQFFNTLGDLTNVNLFYNAHLGRGDDLFDVDFLGVTAPDDLVPGEIANTLARFHIHGNKGDDVVDIDALGVNLDATSSLRVKFHGLQDSDQFFFDYQGQLNGNLRLWANGGQRDDTLAVNLALDAGSGTDVIATVKGGSQNDNLTLNATSADAAELADLLIDGGPGQDICVHTDNVEAVRCEA
jgi:hypothetical protein